jgi:uncharacterized LabA/DUF88 family protein
MAKEPLAEKFITYVKLTQRAGIQATYDNFYEWARVPSELRNNDTATQLKKDLTEIKRKEMR